MESLFTHHHRSEIDAIAIIIIAVSRSPRLISRWSLLEELVIVPARLQLPGASHAHELKVIITMVSNASDINKDFTPSLRTISTDIHA
jgi:hypothetical protein